MGKISSLRFVLWCLTNVWTWLRVIPTGLRGGCSNRHNVSTIEEAFADCALPTLPGPTPLWEPGSDPGCWADACGFLKPPESDRYWKVRLHGACSISHEALGLRPTDQSCHHETWLHLDFVEWQDVQPQREKVQSKDPLKKNVLRRTISADTKGASVISWATIRSLRDIATFRARPSRTMWKAYILTKWFDGASFPIQ